MRKILSCSVWPKITTDVVVTRATALPPPEVLTHFSGLSNDEGFFLPMFMRLLNFKPAPYFFFTAGRKEKRSDTAWRGYSQHWRSQTPDPRPRILLLFFFFKMRITHHLCFQGCRRGCQCCCRSLKPRSTSHSGLPVWWYIFWSFKRDVKLRTANQTVFFKKKECIQCTLVQMSLGESVTECWGSQFSNGLGLISWIT